ncbi:MAG: hypothetical protein H0V88_05375 [Pyrinomonadaceae bacterium]|nr:hypothetical protein [Pyrinomonadaceae bacterium]
MKMTIKSVRVSTVAAWQAIFSAAFALVTSVVYTVIFLGSAATGGGARLVSGGAGVNNFMPFLIIFMVANGIVGFLGGALCAVLYNKFAGTSVAAIEFETERELP